MFQIEDFALLLISCQFSWFLFFCRGENAEKFWFWLSDFGADATQGSVSMKSMIKVDNSL